MIRHWSGAIVVLLAAGLAHAQAAITVDGNIADWSTVSSCFAYPPTNVSQVCLENDGSTLSTGNLYSEFQSSDAISTDSYVGIEIDINGDGALNGSDRVVDLHFPAGSNTASALEFRTPGTLALISTWTNPTTCGAGAGTSDGWQATRVSAGTGTSIEFSVGKGCLNLAALPPCHAGRLVQAGSGPTISFSDQEVYSFTQHQTGTSDPNVTLVTATGSGTQNTVYWSNPAIGSDGTIVVRQTGSDSTWVPTNGKAYSAGTFNIGTRKKPVYVTIAYASASCSDQSFSDPGLTAGTAYHYHLFSWTGNYQYASGTNTRITSVPTGASALWCYSTGQPDSAQVTVDRGNGILAGGNFGAVASLDTTGNERWRPVSLGGPVQDRVGLSVLHNTTGASVLAASQAGAAMRLDAASGAVLWKTAFARGTVFQAFPLTQLYGFSNATFTGAYADDQTFIATRNNTGSQQIYQLDSLTGALTKTYDPGDLGQVSGSGFIDYTHNLLWVASTNLSGSATLRAISTIDLSPQTVTFTTVPGDIRAPLTRDVTGGQIYAVDNNGNAFGFDYTTRAEMWSYSLGGRSAGYLYPTGRGFIASVRTSSTTGFVQRYNVTSGTTISTVWATPPSIPVATVPVVDFTNSKIFVGSNDGKLHQIDATTGLDEKQVVVPTIAPGATTPPIVFAPALDPNLKRIYTETDEGLVCALPEPF